jgi:hypothetical protein
MASVLKNLSETDIRRACGGGKVVLVLRWAETGTHWRRIQAETYRLAARVCERSLTESWVVGADVAAEVIGRGLLATLVTLELAVADEGETARATALLERVAHGLRRG